VLEQKEAAVTGATVGESANTVFKFQSGEEGFLCGMDTLQIMTDFEGRVVAVGRQVL